MATLRLGDIAPDFEAETSQGKIKFHEWLGDSWGVLFSHPADFTPVCTTELGTVANYYPEFKKRNVKVGKHVAQGDVIGWVGMTGNTGGPHVCYRFWKNGKQVDPFKQDLPLSKPLQKKYQETYFDHISPLKKQLDELIF